MQGIHNYTPKTNHVSRAQNISGGLYLQFVPHAMLFTICATCNVINNLCHMQCYLQFVPHAMLFTICATCNVISRVLYFYISTLRSRPMCAVPNMALFVVP
jgi:branched-subunit amino acid transport protein